jgi:small-conductance mechanosensitive channel
MMHQWRLGQAKTAEERNAEIARHNQASEAFQAQLAQSNQELRKLGLQIQQQGQQLQILRHDEQRQRAQEGNVTKFANELQQNKIPNLSASITSLNNTLNQYEGKDDIPGVGVIEGSKLIPGFMRSREAANVKSALQAVSNDLLNLYSGLAVTLPESERRELEMMANGQFTEANFKDAWQRTVNRYNSVLGNMAASVSGDVIKEYEGRPGAMSLKPLVPAFSKDKKPDVPPPPAGFSLD